jgi:DNA-binding NarL/FixJ family response regulator
MSRILIADSHGLYRKGLRVTLVAALTDVEVWEADCLDRVLPAIECEHRFDLILIDICMRGPLSFDNLFELRQTYPQTPVMVLSGSNTKEDAIGCLRAGLHGYISKLQPENEIIGAVKQVLAGGMYAPPWLAQPTQSRHSSLTPIRNQSPHAQFTPRQRDVLPLLATGKSNKEIARTLNIAEATTKIHAAAVCRILGVRNRTEAALAARDLLKHQVNQRLPERQAMLWPAETRG